MRCVVFLLATFALCNVFAMPTGVGTMDELLTMAATTRDATRVSELLNDPASANIQPQTVNSLAMLVSEHSGLFAQLLQHPSSRLIDIDGCLSTFATNGNRDAADLVLPRASPDGITRAVMYATLSGRHRMFSFLLTHPHLRPRAIELTVMASIWNKRSLWLQQLKATATNTTLFYAGLRDAGTDLIRFKSDDSLMWLLDQEDYWPFIDVHMAFAWMATAIENSQLTIMHALLTNPHTGVMIRHYQTLLRAWTLQLIRNPILKDASRMLRSVLVEPLRLNQVHVNKLNDERLVSYLADDDADMNCPICFGNIGEPSDTERSEGTNALHEGVFLHCGGRKGFHADCLQRWIDRDGTGCPNCRDVLPLV